MDEEKLTPTKMLAEMMGIKDKIAQTGSELRRKENLPRVLAPFAAVINQVDGSLSRALFLLSNPELNRDLTVEITHTDPMVAPLSIEIMVDSRINVTETRFVLNIYSGKKRLLCLEKRKSLGWQNATNEKNTSDSLVDLVIQDGIPAELLTGYLFQNLSDQLLRVLEPELTAHFVSENAAYQYLQAELKKVTKSTAA